MIISPGKLDRNEVENVITETFLYDRFHLQAINQHKWEGLKEHNIKERYVEQYLFYNGFCIFFEDPELGFMCLPGAGKGVNVYGDYTSYVARGHNYSREIPATECVVIENNKLRLPTHKAVFFFVSRLYELTRTMDVNVRQLKLQSLFSATDKNILTVKKIVDEIEKNNWAIITDSTSINAEDIVKAIPTGVKCLTPELTDRYNAVMNEALTYFGINNSNTDKRERLITDEANANNQFIDSCAEMFLESRQRACEEIREKFGIEISVDLRNKREEVSENVSAPTPEDGSE